MRTKTSIAVVVLSVACTALIPTSSRADWMDCFKAFKSKAKYSRRAVPPRGTFGYHQTQWSRFPGQVAYVQSIVSPVSPALPPAGAIVPGPVTKPTTTKPPVEPPKEKEVPKEKDPPKDTTKPSKPTAPGSGAPSDTAPTEARGSATPILPYKRTSIRISPLQTRSLTPRFLTPAEPKQSVQTPTMPPKIRITPEQTK